MLQMVMHLLKTVGIIIVSYIIHLGDKPYYIRSKPVKFNQQPLDAVMYPKERSKEVLSAHTFTCNISIEPVACGLKPCLWWYHNGSAVINGSTPEMNIKNSENGDTQLWSQLTTVRAGTYQCVVDDGYFITVSREAHLSLQEGNYYNITDTSILSV